MAPFAIGSEIRFGISGHGGELAAPPSQTLPPFLSFFSIHHPPLKSKSACSVHKSPKDVCQLTLLILLSAGDIIERYHTVWEARIMPMHCTGPIFSVESI
jgi:hypothetical protein